MLVRQQPQMEMRHRRRMPVVRIAAVHVGKRRLSEAQEQRQDGRGCQQSFQESQCMFPGVDGSMLVMHPGRIKCFPRAGIPAHSARFTALKRVPLAACRAKRPCGRASCEPEPSGSGPLQRYTRSSRPWASQFAVTNRPRARKRACPSSSRSLAAGRYLWRWPCPPCGQRLARASGKETARQRPIIGGHTLCFRLQTPVLDKGDFVPSRFQHFDLTILF